MTDNTRKGPSCEELLQGLNEYLDGAAISAICAQFADHLAGCHPCQIVVDNIRNTITLYQCGESYPMPPALTDRLKEALRAKWRAHFPVPVEAQE